MKKNIFLSFKFTGEDIKDLNRILGKIISKLRFLRHNVYCSIEDENNFINNRKTNKEILDYVFKKIDKSDIFFVFLDSKQKSEGMLIEVGYAIAKKKKIIVAIKKGVKTNFLEESANLIIKFSSINDLFKKLNEQDFNF